MGSSRRTYQRRAKCRYDQQQNEHQARYPQRSRLACACSVVLKFRLRSLWQPTLNLARFRLRPLNAVDDTLRADYLDYYSARNDHGFDLPSVLVWRFSMLKSCKCLGMSIDDFSFYSRLKSASSRRVASG